MPLRIQRRVVILVLLCGIGAIAALGYYSISQINNLSRKNYEALKLTTTWDTLKESIQKTLTSPDIDEALNSLSLSTDQFDKEFSIFMRSEVITQLVAEDLELGTMAAVSDSLWLSLRPRLENLQLRIQMYLSDSVTLPKEYRGGLLLDLGYKMGSAKVPASYLALNELIEDITHIVSASGARFSAMLTVTVDHLSARIESRVYALGLVSLVLAAIIVVVIVFYINRAQREISQSERRYRSLHDNIPDGVFRVTVEGIFISANPALVSIAGLHSAEEIIGRNAADFFVDREAFDLIIDRLIKNKSVESTEFEIRRVDNRIEWCSVSARVVDDEFGNALYFDGIASNISQRKKDQRELLEMKRELEQVLQLSPAVIYRCGPGPDFPTLFISDNVRSKYGYFPKEFYDDPFYWTKMIHPEDKDEIIGKLDYIAKGFAVVHHYRIKHCNGDYIWIYDSLNPIFDEEGNVNGIIGTWLDITEQKHTEEALRQSEATLQSLLTAAPVGIGLTHDRKLSWVSDYLAGMLGYTKEYLVGKSARVLYDSDEEYARVGDVKYRQIDEKGIGWVDTQWVKKDGSIIDVHLRSTPLERGNLSAGVIFTALDISYLIIAESALRESEERFRAIFETAQDAIFIKDVEQRYISVNPALEKLFGLSVADIIGKTDEELYGSEVTEHTRQVDARVLSGEIINEQHSRPIRGNLKTFHVIKVPMRDGKGNIVGLCGIARDITETKRLQDIASRAQRLETAGRIAGQVAHDFNNLLAPLVAYPAFIRDELPADHPALSFVNDIERAAEQIADINQQLLTLGRRGHYNQEPLQLNDLVEQSVAQIPHLPDTIVIERMLAPDLLLIQGGGAQLLRVLANLLSNAVDSLEGAGTITLKTENFYVDAKSGNFNSIPNGEYVKLTMADTGCGLAHDLIPKVFDPFFTTKKADRRRGSGLGLSIVHAVIEDHNGFIDFDSEPGKGTSVFVYLPITRDRIERPASEGTATGSEAILVVDDDAIQREVSHKILKKLGYSVHTVASGEEALNYLATVKPDLLILDMIMPGGIDGTETFRKSRQLHSDLKAIIVSGYSESAMVKQVLAMGAGAFVRKPLTVSSLAAAVRLELDRA